VINGSANGVNGNHVPIANGIKINGHHQPENNTSPQDASSSLDLVELDVPSPTANGGYTHTKTSRAKISAANKGKTPWNKGQARSPEVRARIAEGVRRRNREKFLAKLAEEGITEEEHDERKRAARRKKDAERRARKTAKGGYTPTEETKKKISKILKEKYANGEVKRKPRDPSTVRRGFKHTEETKQKIRESLRRKWAEDVEYREYMTNKTVASGNIGDSVRKRISETLKKKWEDPEFRANMMAKFKTRKRTVKDDSHRKKISEAMKRKWMDEEYRRRATEGMAKGREIVLERQKIMRETVRLVQPVQPKLRAGASSSPQKGASNAAAATVQPLTPLRKAAPAATRAKTKAQSKTKRAAAKKKRTSKKSATKNVDHDESDGAVEAARPITSSPAATRDEEPREEEHPDDGCISRLREERRDLYDLLYGDEDDDELDKGRDNSGGRVNGRHVEAGRGGRASRVNREANPVLGSLQGEGVAGLNGGVASDAMAALLGDDDDLDDFDPYGLQS